MLESPNIPYLSSRKLLCDYHHHGHRKHIHTSTWPPPPCARETHSHCCVTTTTMHAENTLTLLCDHQHMHTGNTFTLANMSMLFSILSVAQSLDNTKMKAEVI